MPHKRIAFVIADGSHGRIVQRSHDGGGFRTERVFRKGDRVAPARHGGTVFESASPERHGLDDKHTLQRRTEEAYAALVAAEVDQWCTAHPVEGLVLVAPARLLPDLRERIRGQKILAELAKDYVQEADHALAERLEAVELEAERAA